VRDIAGNLMPGTGMKGARIYIADTGTAPVSGHDHVGVFNPEYSLYEVELSETELLSRKIDLNGVTYLDDNGDITTVTTDAEKIQFTCNAGIIGDIKYLPHADYIDLSDIVLEVESLPSKRYVLIYEGTYLNRRISDNNELLCVEDNEVITSSRLILNHPGEVLLMMTETTPFQYFTKSKKSEDSTIGFYRPFSDALQDIHDEQDLLKKVNWIYDVAPENIPYLGFMLGWELPYFPQSVDSLRRAVLRNTVKLQRLKGSKRAVKELFDLFGFAVRVGNIWWTPDGELAGTGEQLPPALEDFEVESTETITTEPLLLEFTEDGFGQTTVPLIYDVVDRLVTVRAYVATRGTAAHTFLANTGTTLSTDFDALDYAAPATFRVLPSAVSGVEGLAGLLGSSTALIDTDGYVSEIATTGDAPILRNGLKQDYISREMSLSLSRYYEFDSDDEVLYIFATYAYNKITVPTSMANLQSNRFDMILTEKDGEQVDPDVILFLVDFLFKIKAFHSLLRKVIIAMLASDTYQVTDFCVGGLVEQDITTDAGQQQTPPESIIPVAPGDCPHYTPEEYGFRRWDIEYRERVLGDLQDEFDAWAALEANCAASDGGQDRTTEIRSGQTDLSEAIRSDEDAPRDTLCTLDGNNYCYEGRPRDRTMYQMVLDSPEVWRFKPCDFGMGQGVYYMYPAPGFLGDAVQTPYIGATTGINPKYQSFMGRKYRAYSRTASNSLHYSNDPYGDLSVEHEWLALIRPSLNIQHDNLNFPGHRLPGMGALEADFTSATWDLKPWDVPLSCECNSPRYANPLNAELVVGSSGSESLVFDETPYVAEGNGLIPDISGLNEHVVGSGSQIDSADDVTHSIYGDMTGGHAAISLQGLTQSIGVMEVPEGLFRSAVDCDSTTSDYSAGYPAISGFLSSSELGGVSYFPASSNPDSLANGLGLPSGTSAEEPLLFTLSSQIVVDSASFNYDYYRHHRLDCGCLHLACDVTAGSSPASVSSIISCTVSDFLSEYDSADNDQVEYDRAILLNETITTPLLGLDNPLSSLFELNQTLDSAGWTVDPNGGTGDDPFPPEGSFGYKDSYGTIYEIYWETIDYYLDIVIITKEPRVWGTSYKTGQLINREVYRDGLITTARQIFISVNSGWQLVGEASEQVRGRFQTTFLCGTTFTDPFAAHLGHNIQDTVGWAVIQCGSGDVTSTALSGVDGPGSDVETLFWDNIFGDQQDITAVCG